MANVVLQAALLLLPTWAVKWFLSSVCSFMLFELWRGAERSLARSAFEGLVSSESSFLYLQISWTDEILRTVRALELFLLWLFSCWAAWSGRVKAHTQCHSITHTESWHLDSNSCFFSKLAGREVWSLGQFIDFTFLPAACGMILGRITSFYSCSWDA